MQQINEHTRRYLEEMERHKEPYTGPASEKHRGIGVPDCGPCGGLGYVSYDLPDTHPDFGKMFKCECVAQTEDYYNRLVAMCGLTPGEYAKFGELWDEPGLEEVNAAARQFVGATSGFFLIVGDFGSGKSAVGAWMIIKLVKARIPARYILMSEYIEALQASYEQPSLNLQAIRHEVSAMPFLVVDESEQKRSTSDFTLDQIHAFVDARARLIDEKATCWIFTPDGYNAFAQKHPGAWDRLQLAGRKVFLEHGSFRGALGDAEAARLAED